jgi:hypothetical protein
MRIHRLANRLRFVTAGNRASDCQAATGVAELGSRFGDVCEEQDWPLSNHVDLVAETAAYRTSSYRGGNGLCKGMMKN